MFTQVWLQKTKSNSIRLFSLCLVYLMMMTIWVKKMNQKMNKLTMKQKLRRQKKASWEPIHIVLM